MHIVRMKDVSLKYLSVNSHLLSTLPTLKLFFLGESHHHLTGSSTKSKLPSG